MASLNNCMFIGNATKDTEIRHMSNGDPVASFTVAVNEAYTKKDGSKAEAVEYVNCTAFGKLAGVCGDYIKKGQSVYVSGRMKTDKYTDKEGVEKYSTKIIVDRMQLLGGKSEQVSQPTETRKPADDDDGIPF